MHNEIVALHDFVLPTSTALWHFRGVIEREVAAEPSISTAHLATKYNVAPGTRSSTNLKEPFLTHTWDAQRERLAETALVGIIALYEIWCEEICSQFSRPELAIKMQFPTNATASAGVRYAVAELAASPSPMIAASVYPALVASKKYAFTQIDNLLKCFRYFKELRNCLMHRGRHCDGKLFGALSEFIPVANKVALGMTFVPVHGVYRLGDPVGLALHGVLGFTEVILRIITTIDAELSKTVVGEAMLVQRIKNDNPTPFLARKLPKALDTIGWKGTNITPALTAYLKAARVIN